MLSPTKGMQMSGLVDVYERGQRRTRGTRMLVVVAIASGVAVWFTAPIGIITVASGSTAGWWLIALGTALLAVAIAASVAAFRRRATMVVEHGKANPRFDEPQPSQNPVGGNSMIDSGIGAQ
jgi:Kef-type K+ transport system membrane component KefB